jgi:peroxiredoxin
MKYILGIFSVVTVLISCQSKSSSDGYVVNGIIKNLPDSTTIFIYLDMDTILDSAMVINEKFKLEGEVERPLRVNLRIKNTRGSRTFWLESKEIDIIGEKGNIGDSKIDGSTTQKEAELLMSRKDSIYKKMENLRDMITNKNRDSLFLVHEKMIDNEVEINKKFIKDYPNSYESLTVLSEGTMQRLGKLETKKLFSLINEELRYTEEGKTIAEFIKLPDGPKVGDKYVDFELSNTNGQKVSFSNKMGKLTLLEFWASWCGPCRSSNPELLVEYEKYKNDGFKIIGVSLDTHREKWLEAVRQDELTWENLSDLEGFKSEPAMVYGVTAIPDNFLIDENGIIIARYLRGVNLVKKLNELFDN